MRFPRSEELDLPARFEQLVPGQLHPDGRRYLPLIILRPLGGQPHLAAVPVTPPDLLLGVVDRHHFVDQGREGALGTARLVCALSTLRMQQLPYRQGIMPEDGVGGGRASTTPVVLGQVRAVLAWESNQWRLPYETLYTELILDIGVGVVGVRTSVTASDLASVVGKAQLEPGDWVELARSRIDILAFA